MEALIPIVIAIFILRMVAMVVYYIAMFYTKKRPVNVLKRNILVELPINIFIFSALIILINALI